MLATLAELGWAEQDADTGFYRLTMRLAILGQHFYVATGIADICHPLLDILAARSGGFARLAIVDGGTLTWVADAQGATGSILYQPMLGINTVPLYVTATGKAWLSFLPREVALQHVLKSGFKKGRFGPNVIGYLEKLMAELGSTAKRGFGLAVNEAEPSVFAVATVICAEATGVALGTVSIAGPRVRMTAHRGEELGAVVIQAAAELASLWPLRPCSSKPLNRRDFAEA